MREGTKGMISVTIQPAPKDQTFIGLFSSLPYPTLAAWNPADENYTYASLAASTYHGKDEFYFENEWTNGCTRLVAWKPMPEVTLEEYKEFEACVS